MTGPARGGRPRDPELDRRILDTTTFLLAEYGRAGVTGDAIASRARIGKASIFRRWPTLRSLLCDVVADLGVRPVSYGSGPGTLREYLALLLLSSTATVHAAAEQAVLSEVGRDADLHAAYAAGPAVRLALAVEDADRRSRRRGEPAWRSHAPVFAGRALLMTETTTDAAAPTLVDCARVVDGVVLPGILDRSAVSV